MSQAKDRELKRELSGRGLAIMFRTLNLIFSTAKVKTQDFSLDVYLTENKSFVKSKPMVTLSILSSQGKHNALLGNE